MFPCCMTVVPIVHCQCDCRKCLLIMLLYKMFLISITALYFWLQSPLFEVLAVTALWDSWQSFIQQGTLQMCNNRPACKSAICKPIWWLLADGPVLGWIASVVQCRWKYEEDDATWIGLNDIKSVIKDYPCSANADTPNNLSPNDLAFTIFST